MRGAGRDLLFLAVAYIGFFLIACGLIAGITHLVTGGVECMVVQCIASPDGSGITVIEK